VDWTGSATLAEQESRGLRRAERDGPREQRLPSPFGSSLAGSHKEVTVSAASWLEYQWWSKFGGTPAERKLHGLLARHRPLNVLQVGPCELDQTVRLLRTALRFRPDCQLRYTLVDEFEGSKTADEAHGLRQIYRRLRSVGGIRVQLLPVQTPVLLGVYANLLGPVDLLLLGVDMAARPWSDVGRQLPLLASDKSLILLLQGTNFRPMTLAELSTLGRLGVVRQAA
jgi:hypothetical protein